ncbi:DUF4345 domain-containing protein [Phenylobacterium sp.]|jgi:hypothetical protein|uniref:DUF4345 domain-containing protein n=1 Tax=Phenylobacterium sp. TaxID=1871053 RepID=UPI002F93C25E
MIAARLERRLLQAAVAAGGVVPVWAGGAGALGLLSDSEHFRYLSGLLLGVGLAFWWTLPTIERRGAVFRVLAAIVVLGGLARLLAVIQHGPSPGDGLPLVMELAVTPLLALWREGVERRLAA